MLLRLKHELSTEFLRDEDIDFFSRFGKKNSNSEIFLFFLRRLQKWEIRKTITFEKNLADC